VKFKENEKEEKIKEAPKKISKFKQERLRQREEE
jgi:hypothetical protein